MRSPVLQAELGLVDGRQVACGHPPKRQMRLLHPVKPCRAPCEETAMHGAVHVVLQLLDGQPYRQVDDDEGIIVPMRDRRIPGVGLVPPDESGAPVGESIDLIQGGYEFGHNGVIAWTAHLRDVHLCKMAIHPFSAPWMDLFRKLKSLTREWHVDARKLQNGLELHHAAPQHHADGAEPGPPPRRRPAPGAG